MIDLWICEKCRWKGKNYLTARSPFDAEDELIGCPKCKAVDSLVAACDEPGCNEISTCGFPVEGGKYRRACGKHYREAEARKAALEGKA